MPVPNIQRRTLGVSRLLVAFAVMLCLQAPVDSLAQGLKNDSASTEEATGEIEFSDAGMTGARTYESPQYGFELSWGRDWELDTYNYDPPVESNPESEIDSIALIWFEGVVGFGRVRIHGALPDYEDEAAWVEAQQEPEFIAENWESQYEVEPILDYVDDDSGQVLFEIVDTADNDAVYYTMFETVELENGTWIYFTLTTSAESFADAFDEVTGELEMDGETAFLTGLDWDEIEVAVDKAA